ncbi:MAG: hypothetical protein ACFBQW_09825 [Sphingomonadaceae bacterium]
MSWRRRTRRLFLLLLPAALPLWLMSILLASFAHLMEMLWTPVDMFWNQPAKRSYSDYYSHYYQRD